MSSMESFAVTGNLRMLQMRLSESRRGGGERSAETFERARNATRQARSLSLKCTWSLAPARSTQGLVGCFL